MGVVGCMTHNRDTPERREGGSTVRRILLLTILLGACALTPQQSQNLRNAGQALQGGGSGGTCERDEDCAAGETCRDGVCL